MAIRGAGNTAYGAAFMKAMEGFLPPQQRLFEDTITLRLLPPVARAMLRIAPLRRWRRDVRAAIESLDR
jgi:hypothetical protein